MSNSHDTKTTHTRTHKNILKPFFKTPKNVFMNVPK